ncbi:hypothetical protein [Streptomyces daliensis]|uniref:Uncharacterized protein n=1 Tax=Streptomyces daliensis TaxID=299421 RepID=A0A8T4ITR0_9ACTN|nr:hypothetical protein [Streptomyces daliensis]
MSRRDVAPFRVGDRVRGISYVPAERREREASEEFQGTVVQIGSGYAGVDADRAFLWARVDDHTERQALVRDTELLDPAEAGRADR